MTRIDPSDEKMNRHLCGIIGAQYFPPDAKNVTPARLRRVRMSPFGNHQRALNAERLDCLSLRRAGYFGNNYIQLIHVLAVAEAHEIPLVMHPFATFGRGPADQKVRLRPGKTRPWRRDVGLKGRFFAMKTIEVLRTLTPARFLELSDAYVKPALKWRAITAKGRLVLNLRGGKDIFEGGSPPAHYGQPPLSYFVAAAEAALVAHNITHIQIVHQDERNPVLGPLHQAVLRMGVPVSLSSGGPRTDAEAIMSAEHLVIGQTTFPEALALMSPGIVSLATFGAVNNEGTLQLAMPVLRRFDPTREYSVSTAWLGTDDQRAEMLNYLRSDLQMTERTSDFAVRRSEAMARYVGVVEKIRQRLRVV